MNLPREQITSLPLHPPFSASCTRRGADTWRRELFTPLHDFEDLIICLHYACIVISGPEIIAWSGRDAAGAQWGEPRVRCGRKVLFYAVVVGDDRVIWILSLSLLSCSTFTGCSFKLRGEPTSLETSCPCISRSWIAPVVWLLPQISSCKVRL